MNELVTRGIIVMQQGITSIRERVKRAEQGQSLVEYALILAVVAIVVIVAMKVLQPAISGTFNHVSNCLNTSQTPVPTGTPTSC